MSPTDQVEILYADEHVVAVNKAPGVIVVPLRSGKAPCLKATLAEQLGREVWSVHRLDRETSGVVLFALDAESHRDLSIQFQNRRVRKTYLAIVRGKPNPPEGTIDLPLERDRNPIKMTVARRGGKSSQTDYRTLEVFRGYSLVEVRPRTGRMHQIRVHMLAIGNPLAVDPLYGGTEAFYLSQIKPRYKQKEDREERPLISRLSLHAKSLMLTHPVSRTEFSVQAPMPHDFALVLKQLARHASDSPAR